MARRPSKVSGRRSAPFSAAGHIDVTVVHDATGLPASGVIVLPLSIPQPRRGSFVVSGLDGVSDEGGHVTLDLGPGGSTLVAIFGTATDDVVGPAITVDSGAVQPAEIRVP
jgi:hypothetical protein